ncbi:MAG: hypothetical protein JHC37_02330 [Campylobacteraceae bacterium]|nr:hypothetical protein [Campylobacteraceae bacterium]
MQQFLSDLNEILASSLGLTHDENIGISVLSASLLLSLIAFILSIITAVKIYKKKPKLEALIAKDEEPEVVPQKDVTIDIGEFGRILDDTRVLVKGAELEYFILKKNKYEKSSLPPGTIVVILKRNAKEAHVKPADEKDVRRLKGHI